MPSAERIALVERLVRENKSNKEIAEILGIKQSSVRSTIVKCGVERDKNKPCKIRGKPVGTANPKAMYCKECGRRMKSEYARKSAQRNMVEVTCGHCGKKFFGHEAAKFCSKLCYQKAVSEGKYNKVENRIRRKPGKIDIEIRICGKTNERRENVDYYEAREIWRKGWLGRGYAALVTVDGKLLDTIPKWYMGWQYISAQQAMAQAEVTSEEAAEREQAAYYKGWQDCKQYYLENFGGIN